MSVEVVHLAYHIPCNTISSRFKLRVSVIKGFFLVLNAPKRLQEHFLDMRDFETCNA